MTDPLLSVRDLSIRFGSETGTVQAVDGVSFDVARSETVCVVGESVAEPLRIHGMRARAKRREIVTDLLSRVGLGSETHDRFPHELSGGQKQRAALARALALNPDLLVLDEPTSALDVSVQAEILRLLADLRQAFDLSLLVITHDMGVVRTICDHTAVMYLGEIVEHGPTREVFEAPQHPYTEALVASVPSTDPDALDRSVDISGEVPDASNPPEGCRFHTRCPAVIPPDEYAFADEEFRRVMDLRVALGRDDLDPDSIREWVDGAAEAAVRAAIRAEFDLPDELSDPDAAATLSRAIGAIADDRLDEAADLLAREFESVCERDHPTLRQEAGGHEAACHLVGE